MVAVDRDRVEAREAASLGESLLTVAALYGPNASGKSNIVAAFTWLRDAVQHSLRTWDDEIPVEPFAFGDGPGRPSEFIVELLVDGIRFEYVLEVHRRAVHYEGLFHYPEKRRRRVFERESGELKLQRGLGGIAGTRELMTDRTLVLTAARRFREPLVSKFAGELLRTLAMSPGQRLPEVIEMAVPYRALRSTVRWFEYLSESDQEALFDVASPGAPPGPDREQALALLRIADLGIDDVLIDEGEKTLQRSAETGASRPPKRVRLVHRAATEKVPLDFRAESEGTRTWFRLIGPVLTALRSGSLLLLDELDASLHPTLSAQLLGLFHNPATNPRGAQLVFTAHDTSLLNHLNRDEVWLTEKSDSGATRLGALAEFAGERVRRSQNLERAYLHGRFGALPDVDQAELLRALGLIG
ncbi:MULTISPECIES: ATP/GTP-binding protein [Protofrankia]|nr:MULTISPECIES: ATP-binding protein [Protofrankia]